VHINVNKKPSCR